MLERTPPPHAAPASCDPIAVFAAQMHEASGAETKSVCTEAGMFALRERRVHVSQDDFEMAVAKVMKKDSEKNMSLKKLWTVAPAGPWLLPKPANRIRSAKPVPVR